VRLELQACPPGVEFAYENCTNAITAFVPVNGTTPEALLSFTFTGLTDDTLYHWRARVLHAPSTGTTPPKPAHGPWRRLGAQSVEADIRLPEPGFLFSLASGLALVAALARRRRCAG